MRRTRSENTLRALSDYDMAIRLDPNDAEAYNKPGCLRKIALGHPEAAISDYDKAIQLKSKQCECLLQPG